MEMIMRIRISKPKAKLGSMREDTDCGSHLDVEQEVSSSSCTHSSPPLGMECVVIVFTGSPLSVIRCWRLSAAKSSAVFARARDIHHL